MTVQTADEAAGDVGDNEANETDRAYHRHHGTDHEAAHHDEDKPGAIRVHPECSGGVVAEREGVDTRAQNPKARQQAQTTAMVAQRTGPKAAMDSEPSSQNITERAPCALSEAKTSREVTAVSA